MNASKATRIKVSDTVGVLLIRRTLDIEGQLATWMATKPHLVSATTVAIHLPIATYWRMVKQ